MTPHKILTDVLALSGRRLRVSLRNPETWTESVMIPLLLMFVFVYLMSTQAYDGGAFISSQVASVLVLCAGFAITSAAYAVNADLRGGIIDRFRSMPVFQPAVIGGHMAAGAVRVAVIVAVVIGVGFAIGFRPEARWWHWVGLAVLLGAMTAALTWVAALIGLTARSADTIMGPMTIVQCLPFLSSGFADVDQLPAPLRVAFAHQPFTPIVDSARGLLAGTPQTSDVVAALAWCAAVALVFGALSMRAYGRRST